MQIQITGKHLETGDALRTYVETQIEAGISKYFERGADVHVTFSKQGHAYRTDCTVHLDSGLRAQAHSDDADIYAGFEQALTKMEKQLRRYKRRLKNHHAKSALKNLPPVTARTLQAEPQDGELPEDYQPVTIAESTVELPVLSVSEAVMQMELTHADHLVFRAAGHGGVNIVHRREDGHIGWLDPA